MGPGGVLLVVLVHQGLEGGKGHVRAAFLVGGEGVDPEQAEIQLLRLQRDGLVQGVQRLAEHLVVIRRIFEEIVLPAQGIGHGQQGFATQVAVLGQLDDAGALRLGEPEGETGQVLLQVLRIIFGPAVQQGFHAHAGKAHAANEVVVSTDIVLLRGLGEEGEGQRKRHEDGEESFHRISILILRSLG